MPKIQKLSALLTQQIAAGEVIARPASVVKELLENSLDAGALDITLSIQAGGKKYIQVEDNGVGIEQEDLYLALLPHATSKIKSLTDLEEVESFGFRGEALASLTGVSRITVISKPANQPMAWKIESEPTAPPVLQPSAMGTAFTQGTCVEVKDLFYQIPARKKFLKADRTEQLQIESIFKSLAIYYTQVNWVLKTNQIIRYQFTRCTGSDHRLQRLGQLYGEKLTQHFCPLQLESGSLKLTGWILDLDQSYPNTDIQWVYVNGRVVRDRIIQHAIRQAIQVLQSEQVPGLKFLGLETGYLVYCLFLSLPSSQVDVNVHPMKEEVRFENSRAVYQLVFQAVLSVFQKNKSGSAMDAINTINPIEKTYSLKSYSSVMSNWKANLSENPNPRETFILLSIEDLERFLVHVYG